MPQKTPKSEEEIGKSGQFRKPGIDPLSAAMAGNGDDEVAWPQLRGAESPAVTDPLNRTIVALLQDDGRMSYSAIARQVGISEGAVRNRVNRMIEDKVFKIMAVADPVKLGYSAYAMIAMKLSPGTNPEAIAEDFRRCDEVVYVMFTAGQYDLLVEVLFKTQDELRAFLVSKCYARPEITSVEPMLPLAMYKYQLKWGQA
jgi:Lrp/AsnC family transcriptional regulator for asnA, asnC and gidA